MADEQRISDGVIRTVKKGKELITGEIELAG